MRLSTNKNMDFLLYEKGEPFLLNGILNKGLFVKATDKISKNDEVILTTKFPYESGGLIYYQNQYWLMVSEIQNDNNHDVNIYRVRIRKCNNILTVNIGGILHNVPCIVMDKISLNIDSSTYISTLDSQIYILLQDNVINSNIKINDIYKIGKLNYSVQNIDDLSQSELLYIKMIFTAEEQVLPDYSIEILNGESATTNIDTPVQLITQQKDGDIILAEPLPVIFSTSNEAIATVSSIGLVTPKDIGNVTILVRLESDESVIDSIAIIIDDVPQDNFSYELVGESEIYLNYSETYTANKYNNGILVPDSEFNFTIIPGSTPTSAYTLTITNNTQCNIMANSKTHYITLRAADRADSSQYVEKSIKLASLF